MTLQQTDGYFQRDILKNDAGKTIKGHLKKDLLGSQPLFLHVGTVGFLRAAGKKDSSGDSVTVKLSVTILRADGTAISHFESHPLTLWSILVVCM